MKWLSLFQINKLADYHGGEVVSTPYPAIDFDGYGFEATELYDNKYSGWRFYGNPSKQAELLDLWGDLTLQDATKPVLSIEAAKKLIGKKVRVSYSDVNKGQLTFLIKDVREEESERIGQVTNMRLLFHQIIKGEIKEETCDWIYEWQGIFRFGSGAERLFIEQIYEA